ncbi:MAG: hypothetical protein HRU19_04120 [Pseudobacteriovorax sp.]|nr:hypothetical protein [Pseudobacteriovorax sp.]
MFKHTVLILLALLLGEGIAFSQAPLLPYNPNKNVEIFLDEAMRDPTIAKQNPIVDSLGYEQILEDMRLWQEELPRVAGLRRIELLKQLYQGHASAAYFLEDVRTKRIVVPESYQNIDNRIKNHQSATSTYAGRMVKYSKNKRESARAAFHLLTIQYITTNIKTGSVKNLKGIKRNLDGYLSRRVDFLEGYHLTEYKNQAKGPRLLKRTLRSMPKLPAIGARVVLAKHYAGLNRNYRKIKKSSLAYKGLTQAIGNRSGGLSTVDKNTVMNHLALIWRKSGNSRQSWSQVPFSMKHFANHGLSLAIIERAAIEDMKKKRYQKSLAKYRAIAPKYVNSRIEPSIDLRIIDINKKMAGKKANTQKIQQIMNAYEKKYVAKKNTSIATTIRRQHYSLVYAKINSSKRSSTNRAARTQAIKTGYRFLQYGANPQEVIKIETDIGRLYSLNKEHKKAVAVYLGLESKVDESKKFQYLNLAVAEQHKAAKWPTKAPWDGIRKGHNVERNQLASLISRRYARTRSWGDMAHIGLLKINLGQGEEAFGLFWKQLQDQPKGLDAAKASGLMAMTYKGSKRWDDFERVSRFCLEKNLNPVHKRKRYNPYYLLADALYLGGKHWFETAKWAKSAQKLEEFSGRYKKDARRPESLYLLGQAFHNDGQHPASIKSLLALVNEYPTSRYERPALLLGGEWSIPMAYEEQTIFFYQRFINRYSRDKEALNVRPLLKELYLGRQLYGDAARIMQDEAKDGRRLKQERVANALEFMETEERFGEIKFASWGASNARNLAKNDPSVLVQVLAFETRVAARQKNYGKLKKIESLLSRLSVTGRDYSEALGQIRFILAERSIAATKNKFYNLELTDPAAILDKQLGLFKKMKNTFDNVCDAGLSSYCGPAMMMLAQATRYTLDAIEEITIPQTLEESVVDAFESKKFNYVTYLDDVATKSIEQALGLSEEGETTPDWSREIRWDTETDWSFEQTNSNAGNGYVQWSESQVKAENAEIEFGADLGGLE